MDLLFRIVIYNWGHSIHNYVDKMRERGSKMSVFVHAQGIKTVHTGGGGSKKVQNCVHVVVE